MQNYEYDREKFIATPEDFIYVGADTEKQEKIYKPSLTYLQDTWRRFKKNKLAIFFLGVIGGYIFLMLFGQLISPYTYYEQNLAEKYLTPLSGFAKGHYLGTDALGRDLFARISQGIRISMFLAIVVSSLCIIIGTVYGAIAAYVGGIIDTIMVRVVELILSIPSMIYIILLMVTMGNSLKTIIIALALTRWLGYALLVRGEVLKLKENEYVLASRSLGGKFWWIARKHLIPNTISVIIVRATMDIPMIIFSEAFLSFIGLGVPIPQASLGNLVSDGFKELSTHLYLFLIPALAISGITLSFNIIGDAINDALNPKLRD